MANQKLAKAIQYMMGTGLFHDEQQAIDIFTASLEALRDRLPKEEAFHLGTRLPESLREPYLNSWRKDQRQAESVNKSEFLAEVDFHLAGYEDHSLTDLVPVALKALLLMIGEEGELVKKSLPRSILNIFEDRQAM